MRCKDQPVAEGHFMTQLIDLQCVDGGTAQAPVLDVADVVVLEQRIARDGTSLLELMTRAGTSLARAVEAHAVPGAAVVILAGSGNNGGDGWVAARALAAADRNVTLVSKAAANEVTAQPARTAAIETASTTDFEFVIAPSDAELARLLDNADVIVDAILGTGFAHDQVREPYATWIRLANAARNDHGARIVAADCPSGLNAQTGTTASDCFMADETVTMIVPKTGLLEPQAHPYVGTLLLAPLISIEEYFDDLL